MRTICDVCENAPAILFCAADEATLCQACDDKVHMCNKLASRHVRVGLADPSEVPSCDICENAPAFFYCEIDGSSLCLQCDMTVHVGGKRTHGRYLVLRQRVKFPGDKPGHHVDLNPDESREKQRQMPEMTIKDRLQNHTVSSGPVLDSNTQVHGYRDSKMIDLNAKPQRTPAQASNSEAQGLDVWRGVNKEGAGVVPVGLYRKEAEK